VPLDGRRVGHPFLRLFLRRLAAGALIATVVFVGAPLAGGRPVLTEQVAGISSDTPSVGPSFVPEAPDPSAPLLPPVPTIEPETLASSHVAFADRRWAATPTSLDGYRWPIPKGRLTLPYGPTPLGTHLVDGEPFHDGIDLATFCGDRIVAAHAGRVLAAGRDFDDAIGWRGDLGPYRRWIARKHYERALPISVVIDDGNGFRSIYAHFSKVTVKVGQLLKAGQLIGYEGATGHATGCHLHYSLFSPLERATIGVRADVRRRLHLPTAKTARVDPLLVLPPREGDPPPLEP
jgi:murein DD-endopeptidase MepM/ murein hydrolase activator NlpD